MEEEKKNTAASKLEDVITSYFWFDGSGKLHKIYGKNSIAAEGEGGVLKQVSLMERAIQEYRCIIKPYNTRIDQSRDANFSMLVRPYDLHTGTLAAHAFFFDRDKLHDQLLAPLDFLSWCVGDVNSEEDARKAFNSNTAETKGTNAIRYIISGWREKFKDLTNSRKNVVMYFAQQLEKAHQLEKENPREPFPSTFLQNDEEQNEDLLWLVLNSALKLSDTSHYYAHNRSDKNTIFTYLPAEFRRSDAAQPAANKIDINATYLPQSSYKGIVEIMTTLTEISAKFVLFVERERREGRSSSGRALLDLFCSEVTAHNGRIAELKKSSEKLGAMINFLRPDALAFTELQKTIMDKGPQTVGLHDLEVRHIRVRSTLYDARAPTIAVDSGGVDERVVRALNAVFGDTASERKVKGR